MDANKKWYDGALVVNRDPCWYVVADPAVGRPDPDFLSSMDPTSSVSMRESLKEYFSRYRGHKITDVLFCVFEQTALLPNKAFAWRGEKYLQKKENGFDVNYTSTQKGLGNLEGLYRCFAEYGVDAAQLFIDTMKELGIRPWLTLRMNDAHFGYDDTAFLRSDMFYEAKAAGEMIGEQYGYYAHCFDFRYPRYREALLGYIAELLERYDIFGLELDFMREIRCFDYLNHPDCQSIMTDYVRRIRALTNAAGERLGHPVRLMIRTCRSPQDAFDFGFDIPAMCAEGLIDAVVPSPRWEITDSGIPIGEWRSLLGEDIAIFGGVETLNVKFTSTRPENTRAYAAAFYAGGADGFYLYNHEYLTPITRRTWMTTRESCIEGRREFVVTYQDVDSGLRPIYKPLPLAVDGRAELPLNIGKVASENRVTVVIDFEGDTAPALSVPGRADAEGVVIEPVVFKRDSAEDIVLTEHMPLQYDLSGISTDNALALTFRGQGVVHYVNIIIEA